MIERPSSLLRQRLCLAVTLALLNPLACAFAQEGHTPTGSLPGGVKVVQTAPFTHGESHPLPADSVSGSPPTVHAQTSRPPTPRATAQAEAEPTFKLVQNIPYRAVDNRTLACDLYIPKGNGPFPTVMFLHGGGWSGGDRKQLRRQASFLAERGFFGVAIDYRLAPEHPFPASLEDARGAVAWIREHAAQYQMDPKRIAAVGSSAGGHLAAMLGVGSGSRPNATTVVQAVVAFNGIYDLNAMPPSDMVARFVGSPCAAAPERCKEASPISSVRPGLPPFLLLHGTSDKTAPYTQATSMVAALLAAHDSADLFTAEGAPHTFWNQPRWMDASFRAMGEFLTEKLGEGTALSPAHASRVSAKAQTKPQAPFNRNEDDVAPYVEPDVLRMKDGAQVRTAEMWTRERRPEILRMLRTQMFGYPPEHSVQLRVSEHNEDSRAFNGLATRKQITLVPAGDSHGVAIHLLLYLPNRAKATVPVFLGLNFAGNQSVTLDSGVDLNTVWLPDATDRLHLHPERATDAMRGTAASEWPIKALLDAGFGFATVYDGDVEPDFNGGEAYGFRSLPALAETNIRADQRWAAIGVWAWGLSRTLDYLTTERRIDSRKVAVIGHSRLGKAALWAGASDERFAMVISNESGKGGAALMKRNFGETVEHLNTRFPYWFDGDFDQYSDRTGEMPFDSHFLLALIAPRPLYIASAAGDFSLDARGEYLAAHLATPVYKLFGLHGLNTQDLPPESAPIFHDIGYHIRPGKHDMTDYDWEQYLYFADRIWLHDSSHR